MAGAPAVSSRGYTIDRRLNAGRQASGVMVYPGGEGNGGLVMKIAIATKDWLTVSGHAGQARCWLVYDLAPGLESGALPAPERVELAKDRCFITSATAARIRSTAWRSWWQAAPATGLSGTCKSAARRCC